MTKPAQECAGLQRTGMVKLIGKAVFFIEFVNTAACIYQFLLTCEKGVTLGADFNLDILLRGAGFDYFSTRAPYGCLLVIGMDTFLH
jgi:hypothetical protein